MRRRKLALILTLLSSGLLVGASASAAERCVLAELFTVTGTG